MRCFEEAEDSALALGVGNHVLLVSSYFFDTITFGYHYVGFLRIDRFNNFLELIKIGGRAHNMFCRICIGYGS